jgi:TPR repeat protein
MIGRTSFVLTCLVFAALPAAAASPFATLCDRLAAEPGDPGRAEGVAGVAFDEIEAERAVAACRKAVAEAPGNDRLAYQLGRALHRAEAYAEAMAWYRKAADAGNARALSNIGTLFDEGSGVAEDDVEAVAWYRKAADLGFSAAMLNLGIMYEEGTGVDMDPAEAARWYRKAADLGDPDAMNALGLLYENGKGVGEDKAEALAWYLKAADLGLVAAIYRVAMMYEYGTGIAADAAAAAKWYRRAAEEGESAAMYRLAVLNDEGRGMPRDYGEAAHWFLKAVKAGDKWALAEIDQEMDHWQEGTLREIALYLARLGRYSGDADGRFTPALAEAMRTYGEAK